jgi:hypothetical protein
MKPITLYQTQSHWNSNHTLPQTAYVFILWSIMLIKNIKLISTNWIPRLGRITDQRVQELEARSLGIRENFNDGLDFEILLPLCSWSRYLPVIGFLGANFRYLNIWSRFFNLNTQLFQQRPPRCQRLAVWHLNYRWRMPKSPFLVSLFSEILVSYIYFHYFSKLYKLSN